jgi:hypothetical protein
VPNTCPSLPAPVLDHLLILGRPGGFLDPAIGFVLLAEDVCLRSQHPGKCLSRPEPVKSAWRRPFGQPLTEPGRLNVRRQAPCACRHTDPARRQPSSVTRVLSDPAASISMYGYGRYATCPGPTQTEISNLLSVTVLRRSSFGYVFDQGLPRGRPPRPRDSCRQTGHRE